MLLLEYQIPQWNKHFFLDFAGSWLYHVKRWKSINNCLNARSAIIFPFPGMCAEDMYTHPFNTKFSNFCCHVATQYGSDSPFPMYV